MTENEFLSFPTFGAGPREPLPQGDRNPVLRPAPAPPKDPVPVPRRGLLPITTVGQICRLPARWG